MHFTSWLCFLVCAFAAFAVVDGARGNRAKGGTGRTNRGGKGPQKPGPPRNRPRGEPSRIQVSLSGDQRVYQARHSFTNTQLFQDPKMENPVGRNGGWDFGGSAVATDKHVRLTPDRQSKVGYLWNSFPVAYEDWEIEVTFHVHGQGKTLFGDGFALWFTDNSEFQQGPAFGHSNSFIGLGLFFDTYQNAESKHKHDHPYVSALVNDGTIAYEHDADGTGHAHGGCSNKFRVHADDEDGLRTVIVSFVEGVLRVKLKAGDADSSNEYADCIDTSTPFFGHAEEEDEEQDEGGGEEDDGAGEEDEEVEPIVLNGDKFFFGLSASTGHLADNHDILAIKAYRVKIKGKAEKQYQEAYEDRQREDGRMLPEGEETKVKDSGRRAADAGGSKNYVSTSASRFPSFLKWFLILAFGGGLLVVGGFWWKNNKAHGGLPMYGSARRRKAL